MLLFELLKWEPRKNNLHQKRLYDEYLDGWEWRFEKTAERVEQAKRACRIVQYSTSDIQDFEERCKQIDPNGIFFGFLPFYKGDYEKLYKRIGEILAWEAPPYQIIDRQVKTQLLGKISRDFNYVLIDDMRHEEYPNVMLKRRTRTKEVFLYSDLPALAHVLVQKHFRDKPTYYARATDADLDAVTTESKIVIKSVNHLEINYYKNIYMKKSIAWTNGNYAYDFMFFVDGKLFGFAVIDIGGTKNLSKDIRVHNSFYLLSDFSVAVDKDKRLSKLVLLTLQSREFYEVLRDRVFRDAKYLSTSAFSDKPVSMKYRGVFDLHSRKENTALNADGKFMLNYVTTFAKHSLQEALSKWIEKYRR